MGRLPSSVKEGDFCVKYLQVSKICYIFAVDYKNIQLWLQQHILKKKFLL